MVRPDYVGNLIVLTLIIALVTAILLFGKIALDLVELPPTKASKRPDPRNDQPYTKTCP
jgi:hypothetical protein